MNIDQKRNDLRILRGSVTWAKMKLATLSHALEKAEAEYRVALHTMPYDEYLKTKAWCAKRRIALEHAHKKCQRCGSADNLNVHHLTYERRGYELSEDLIVLCRKCHEKQHANAD